MQSAVKPFVVVAKHIFRPEAGPISGEMCLICSKASRVGPDIGAFESGLGPETGIEGLFHVWDVGGAEDVVVGCSEASFRDGAPPIIPPSKNLIVGVSVERSSAIERAVFGEMAFRSR